MAIKVRELIAWLHTQDQGATVEVLQFVRGRSYEGDTYRRVNFDPSEHADYIDMRGNEFAVGKPYENARTLFLGSDD